jgi:hypothetical protein
VEPEQLLPAIDPGAYLTGFYALFRDNLVAQMPSEITCFTNRRHNRTSDRILTGWKLRFIRAPGRIYFKPADGLIAPPEQALCDFVYLNLRDSIEPQHLVAFLNLQRLNRRRLRNVANAYPHEVRIAVESVIADLV